MATPSTGKRMKCATDNVLLVLIALLVSCVGGFVVVPTPRQQRQQLQQQGRCQSMSPLRSSASEEEDEEVEVIVLGAGLGGLSCAALASKYGLDTLCLEAHDTPGGCAHSFSRYSPAVSKTVPFQFDSGPSLISGCSKMSTNPLRQLLDAVGTADDIDWCTYDGWIVHDYADGKSFKMTTGNGGEFEQAIQDKAGVESRQAFELFRDKMLTLQGLSEASTYVPPFALRGGVRAVATLARYFFKLLSIGSKGTLLTGPFTKCLEMEDMNDPFVKKWFDYLAFALSGEDAAHTQAAPVVYMMRDLHSKGAILDYPMGGMDSLIQAVISGITNHGGEVRVNSRVESFLLEEKDGNPHCAGVVMSDGKTIRASKGVVCNAPLWNMAKILQESVPDGHTEKTSPIVKAVASVQEKADNMYMTGSFMHLHIGIPKDGLPDDIECHHSVLNMDMDVRAEQNMVIISIPTIFDPSLAPEGYHIVHAYTAASDSFGDWLPFLEDSKESGKVGASPNSGTAAKYNRDEEYQKLKDQKAEALWKAIECVIPDVRERSKRKGSIVMVGTPLTHRRYNQRFRGTYGPGPAPGKEIWELSGANTPIKNLLACGDTTFPGIGLPGVAASGTIAANTLVDVKTQVNLMNELRAKGALQ